MDEKIEVLINGVIHVFAESDITVVPVLRLPGTEINRVSVTVNHMGQELYGTVTLKEAGKLKPEASEKNRLAKEKKKSRTKRISFCLINPDTDPTDRLFAPLHAQFGKNWGQTWTKRNITNLQNSSS